MIRSDDMSEKRYSVSELDELRTAVEHKWLFGSYNFEGAGFSRSYKEEEKAKAVEEMVRTHMLAGHTAEDLYASEQPSRDTGVKNAD
jgi:hypothetical protein